MTRPLPPHTSLSSNALYFLNSNLISREDLDGAPNLLSDLQFQSDALDRTLSELNEELRHWAHSNRLGSLLSIVHAQLDDLRLSSTRPPSRIEERDGGGVADIG